MAEEIIKLYGAHWCPDCRGSRSFLGGNSIPYEFVDVDQDQATQTYVQKMNDNKLIIPTIVFPDSSILGEPSNAELAQKLGITTKASRSFYDLIVVGAGPARLTAAYTPPGKG